VGRPSEFAAEGEVVVAGVAGGEAVVTGVAVGLLTGVAVGLAVGVSATVGDGKGVALGAGVEGWPPEGSAGFCSHAVARKLATTTVKKRHVFMPLDTDARAVRLFKTRCRGPENRAFCKTRRVLQVTEKRRRAPSGFYHKDTELTEAEPKSKSL
jgi:hypothetical protein